MITPVISHVDWSWKLAFVSYFYLVFPSSGFLRCTVVAMMAVVAMVPIIVAIATVALSVAVSTMSIVIHPHSLPSLGGFGQLTGGHSLG